MSYNIDSIKTPVLDAWMTARDVVTLFTKTEDEQAEDCILWDLLHASNQAMDAGDPERRIRIPHFSWRGEMSGSTWKPTFIEQIAPHIMGTVEAIVCWEGGASFTGLLIHDGKVAECEVEMRVVKPEGWQ